MSPVRESSLVASPMFLNLFANPYNQILYPSMWTWMLHLWTCLHEGGVCVVHVAMATLASIFACCTMQVVPKMECQREPKQLT